MIRLIAHPPFPPYPLGKLSLFLILPVCRRSNLLTREGVGEEPNHTTAQKPGPPYFIQYSLCRRDQRSPPSPISPLLSWKPALEHWTALKAFGLLVHWRVLSAGWKIILLIDYGPNVFHRKVLKRRLCWSQANINVAQNLWKGYNTRCLYLLYKPVFRIHDILVWIRIRIRGSMPLTNGSGSFYFHHWPSRCQQKTNFFKKFFCTVLFEDTFSSFFKDKKSKRSHKTVDRVVDPYSFFTDPDPDPDPELDVGGQYGSGSKSGSKFTNFFLLLWVIFALLDPDPDSEYGSGSGSTDPIEYGSNTDPVPDTDPQPCVEIKVCLTIFA